MALDNDKISLLLRGITIMPDKSLPIHDNNLKILADRVIKESSDFTATDLDVYLENIGYPPSAALDIAKRFENILSQRRQSSTT